MAGTVDVGTSTTLTFGTSSYACEVLDISGEVSRGVVDTTHMGTTNARTKRVVDLYDPGSITVNAHFDPEEEAPYSGAEETVTITFPLKAGDSTGPTVAGTAAVTNFSYSVPLEDKMTMSFTISFLDELTWTDGSV